MKKPYKTKQLLKKTRLLYRYILDPKVPFYRKIVIIFGFAYLLFPFDIIPDPIIGLGFIDDIAILFLIFNAFQGNLDKYQQKTGFKYKDKNNIIDNIDYSVKDTDEKET